MLYKRHGFIVDTMFSSLFWSRGQETCSTHYALDE